MISVFLAAYAAVFAAEIVGDKLLYTTSVLATRYRFAPILGGVAMAGALKMAAAVAIGRSISNWPRPLLAGMTACTAFGVASAMWRGSAVSDVAETGDAASATEGVAMSFASVFLSEWGDVGQLAAAGVAAQFLHPVAVWVGAIAAVLTKATVAALAGARIGEWLDARMPRRHLRRGSILVVIVVGVWSLVEMLG